MTEGEEVMPLSFRLS